MEAEDTGSVCSNESEITVDDEFYAWLQDEHVELMPLIKMNSSQLKPLLIKRTILIRTVRTTRMKSR